MVLVEKEDRYVGFELKNNKLVTVPEIPQFPDRIFSVSSSVDPRSGEPVAVVKTQDGQAFCVSIHDNELNLEPLSFPPAHPMKFTVLDPLIRLSIENGVLSQENFEMMSLSTEDVPIDSFFLCATPRKALLISKEEPFCCIVTRKRMTCLQSGYAPRMLTAAFYDDETIVFSTTDSRLNLLNKSGNIQTLSIDSPVVYIIVADIDCYERSCLCLCEDSVLRIAQFSTRTVDIVTEDVVDFTCMRSPFDHVVVLRSDGELEFIKNPRKVTPNSKMANVITALDSRVVAGLSELSSLRARATTRRNMASGNTASMPHMVTMIGTKPEPRPRPEATGPKLWIENVKELTFEIHCDVDLPLICDVIVGSQHCSFTAACTCRIISPQVMSVSVELSVTRMPKFEPFSVFIKDEQALYFVGRVEFDVHAVMSIDVINRISEDYLVTFPPHYFPGELPSMCEAADHGVIVHGRGSTFETFERCLVAISSLFPDGSVFQRKEKTLLQLQVAKEAARYVRSFPRHLAELENPEQIPKAMLAELKSAICDFLGSILW